MNVVVFVSCVEAYCLRFDVVCWLFVLLLYSLCVVRCVLLMFVVIMCYLMIVGWCLLFVCCLRFNR